ncbi:MAG TPA: ABC transporter ATP-binding protein [Opitutaceae bacterium]|nr:ABC transporter ATP-binding protein [Opitutaceae bacterium]
MSASSPPLASIRGLVKRYGAATAIAGVDLTVHAGEIVGLLGQNGAGKTTVFECLLGLRTADAGEILLGGVPVQRRPREALRSIGAQLQPSSLQDKITPREALRFHLAVHGIRSDADVLLARFDLVEKADARFETLSAGQRQRLALALALAHRPALLVLDEPTTGLDPQTRRALHEILRAHRASGGGVLLSTHDLDEAERLCDRVAVLHRGRVLAVDSPATLVARAGASTRLSCRTAQPLSPAVLSTLATSCGATRASGDPDSAPSYEFHAPSAVDAIAALTRAVQEAGNTLVELQLTPPSLEDAFVALTGEKWTRPLESAA